MPVSATPDKVYEACLVELHKMLRAASFYTPDHPALAQSGTRTLRYFQNLLTVTDSLEFTVTKTQITVDDRPLTGQQQVLRALAAEFFRRRVKKLIFLRGITLEELLAFTRAFRLEPDELARRGGMEDALARLGVRSIFCNEVDFNRLRDLEDEVFEEEDGADEDIVEGTPEDTLDLTPEQIAFREMLQHMIDSDGAEFMQLLKEVVDRSKVLTAAGEFREVGVAVDYLFRFSSDSHKGLTPREFAERAIRALASKEVLLEKIRDLQTASQDERNRLILLLQYIGKISIRFLLYELTQAEGRAARRNLTAAIVAFGEKAIAPALELLEDERWFVKRNMLAILAEIGKPALLEQLIPYLDYADARVTKEAVRTIGRIGGEPGLETLRSRGESFGPELQIQLAMLFGGLRWPGGRVFLERLARKADEEEVRAAACEALGKLAAPESFELLRNVFQPRGLLGREKKTSVRRAALRALVNYGQLAEPLLRKALEDEDIEMQGTARIALERIATGDGVAS